MFCGCGGMGLGFKKANDEEYALSKWEEKITDAINYLLLLKVAVMEEVER